MRTTCKRFDVSRLPERLDAKVILSLRERFRELAACGKFCHIVDLDGTDPRSVQTVAATISILRSIRERGGELRVVAGDAEVRRMLAITGLDKIICVFSSLHEAQSATRCNDAARNDAQPRRNAVDWLRGTFAGPLQRRA